MLAFAVRNLLSRPLRTSLSTLGLAVAIAGMVGLFSIAGGLDSVVRRTFDQIPGLLVQQQGAPLPLFSTLPAKWEQKIEQIPGVRTVEAQVFCRVNQLDGKVVLNPPRLAVGIDLAAHLNLDQSVYRDNLVEGRFFQLSDAQTTNCLISREIADGMGKSIDDHFELNGVEFHIVGVYSTGSLLLDVNILMDIDTCRGLARMSSDTVASFYVESDETRSDDELKSLMLKELQNDRSTPDESQPTTTHEERENPLAGWIRSWSASATPGDFENAARSSFDLSQFLPKTGSSQVEVRTASDWGDKFNEFSGDLNLFLGIMTAIGVSIATLSIVNTMMMSVTERTTEFGILRANGWSQRNVLTLMTVESSVIGLLGGLIGALFGWLGTFVVNSIWPDRLQLHAGLTLLALSVLFSVVLGLMGGLYPAWTASRLSPMQSIRRGAS